jgi:hypothetical protein
VKQFSTQLVADHLALSLELQRIADPAAVAPTSPIQKPIRREGAEPGSETDTATHEGATQTGESPLKSQVGATESAAESGALPERPIPRTDDTGSAESRLVSRLADVSHRIGQTTVESLRQQLEQQPAARFDRAYLNLQIAFETQLSAAAKVTHDEAAGTLGQVAQRVQNSADRELKKANDLLEQLETAGTSPGRTDAPASSGK